MPPPGIVGRSAHIENAGKQALTIDSGRGSATWNLPRADDYSLRYLTGTWAGEWHLQTRARHAGCHRCSKAAAAARVTRTIPGSPSAAATQWNEEHGDVWFGALAWSGSWSIRVDEDILGQVRVTGGYNPFDFAYRLEAGRVAGHPGVLCRLHAATVSARRRASCTASSATASSPAVPSAALRPVLYNSWEATEFKVDEPGQERLAEKAAALGVERFVVDDGWFGARDNDHAGLGDWVVNRRKFPNGLKPLIDKVHGLGMSFGLWVEPEMINRDSDLYRAHPDWVLNFPGRDRSEGRHQLVLNLAREDVKAHLLEVLDRLLTENDIQFLKWDYNRNWSEPGWPQMSPDEQQKVYVAYVRNLYDILRQLRARHPKVEIESCSGGGARVDLGIMALTDEVWPSDNTDPSDRLSIQDGFTYAYAPATMMAWVTGSPNWVNNRVSSLDFRFLSSMQGGLGIGANLLEWTPAEEATARGYIAEYKTIRGTVQRGSLYRLLSPQDRAPWSATESVAERCRAGGAVRVPAPGRGSTSVPDPAPARPRCEGALSLPRHARQGRTRYAGRGQWRVLDAARHRPRDEGRPAGRRRGVRTRIRLSIGAHDGRPNHRSHAMNARNRVTRLFPSGACVRTDLTLAASAASAQVNGVGQKPYLGWSSFSQQTIEPDFLTQANMITQSDALAVVRIAGARLRLHQPGFRMAGWIRCQRPTHA